MCFHRFISINPTFSSLPSKHDEETTVEHVENIEVPLEEDNVTQNDLLSIETSRELESRLLTLPLEIRLQIYGHLIDIHPASNCHLAPNPTITGSPPLVKRRVLFTTLRGRSIPESFYEYTQARSTSPSKSTVIPGGRSLNSTYSISRKIRKPTPAISKLPTSFLLTNKQIYYESRLLPFQQNNWIFINWFKSGVYSATTLSKELSDWQLDAIRYVGLEIGGVELVGSKGSCTEDWVHLCKLWKGVWGLSLTIKGSTGGYGFLFTQDCEDGNPRPVTPDNGDPEVPKIFLEKSVLDLEADWITKGLSQLESLRYLELAFLDPECEKDDKMRFCKDLENALGDVQVRSRELVDTGFAEEDEEDGFGQSYPGVWF